MVSSIFTILKVLAVLEIMLTVTHGFTLVWNRESAEQEPQHRHDSHETKVSHFARHGLCNSFEGKKYFYKALKSKFCDMRISFIDDLVMTLCKRRNNMLNLWVAEMFDIDGDGYLTHYEKNLYRDDD